MSTNERNNSDSASEAANIPTAEKYSRPSEVRKAEDYFCDLPELTLAPDMLTLAGRIVDSKTADFDPLTFRDRYEEALLAHLKAKQAGW